MIVDDSWLSRVLSRLPDISPDFYRKLEICYCCTDRASVTTKSTWRCCRLWQLKDRNPMVKSRSIVAVGVWASSEPGCGNFQKYSSTLHDGHFSTIRLISLEENDMKILTEIISFDAKVSNRFWTLRKCYIHYSKEDRGRMDTLLAVRCVTDHQTTASHHHHHTSS